MLMDSAVEVMEYEVGGNRRTRNCVQRRIDRLIADRYRLIESRAGLIETLNALEAENASLRDGLKRSLQLVDLLRGKNAIRR